MIPVPKLIWNTTTSFCQSPGRTFMAKTLSKTRHLLMIVYVLCQLRFVTIPSAQPSTLYGLPGITGEQFISLLTLLSVIGVYKQRSPASCLLLSIMSCYATLTYTLISWHPEYGIGGYADSIHKHFYLNDALIVLGGFMRHRQMFLSATSSNVPAPSPIPNEEELRLMPAVDDMRLLELLTDISPAAPTDWLRNVKRKNAGLPEPASENEMDGRNMDEEDLDGVEADAFQMKLEDARMTTVAETSKAIKSVVPETLLNWGSHEEFCQLGSGIFANQPDYDSTTSNKMDEIHRLYMMYIYEASRWKHAVVNGKGDINGKDSYEAYRSYGRSLKDHDSMQGNALKLRDFMPNCLRPLFDIDDYSEAYFKYLRDKGVIPHKPDVDNQRYTQIVNIFLNIAMCPISFWIASELLTDANTFGEGIFEQQPLPVDRDHNRLLHQNNLSYCSERVFRPNSIPTLTLHGLTLCAYDRCNPISKLLKL